MSGVKRVLSSNLLVAFLLFVSKAPEENFFWCRLSETNFSNISNGRKLASAIKVKSS